MVSTLRDHGNWFLAAAPTVTDCGDTWIQTDRQAQIRREAAVEFDRSINRMIERQIERERKRRSSGHKSMTPTKRIDRR